MRLLGNTVENPIIEFQVQERVGKFEVWTSSGELKRICPVST